MTSETARLICSALLAEKGVAVPGAPGGHEEADIRQLLHAVLAANCPPEEAERALAGIFDAAATEAGKTPCGNGTNT